MQTKMREKIIITGAGQRIGLFLTQYFIHLNYDVIAIVRKEKEELLTLQHQYPDNIELIYKDLNKEKIDVSFWNKLRNNNITGFIHCASTFYYDTIETATNEAIKEQQQVNCNSFIEACTSYMQSDMKNKYGEMGFIAFLDAKLDKLNKDHYSYTLSKLQLQSSIPFLAMSCSPKARINAISPGLVLRSGEQTQEEFEKAQQSLPFGYGVNLENIAEAAQFLIKQKKITGQIITIDAGQHLKSDRDIIFQ